MKTFLTIISLSFLFVSCSSSDDFDYDLSKAIVLTKDDLYPPTEYEKSKGYFQYIYKDGDKDICLAFYWVDRKKGTPTYASIGTCPKCAYEKQIFVKAEDRKVIGELEHYVNPFYYCKSCRSRFSIHNGKPLNDEAKGYSMPIYKAKTKSDRYRFVEAYVWK